MKPDLKIYQDVKQSAEQQHNSYILDKFYCLSSAVAKSILNTPLDPSVQRSGTDYPFRMSQEEWVIMEKKSSVLLMGRSGTGKTTCAVMRMWSRHKAYSTNAIEPLLKHKSVTEKFEENTHWHQLFVTVSSNLCHHIRKYYQGLETTYHSMNNLEYNKKKFELPLSMKGISEDSWPLIITYCQFLQLIDSTFKNPFFKKSEYQKETSKINYFPFIFS